MYENFNNLSIEKQKKIIYASLEEFSENGYKKGSTNNIVRKAEISKGLLFHYFKSKKNLYIYLVDYVINFFINDIFKKAELDIYMEENIFERIKKWTLIKIKFFSKYRLEYNFLAKAMLTVPKELEDEINHRYKKIKYDGIEKLLKDIDTSMFRKDIDKDKGVELIINSLDGISNKYIKKYQGHGGELLDNVDIILEDINEYIDILKWGLYKRN